MKMTRTKIIAGCLIVGVLCFFAYLEYTKKIEQKNQIDAWHDAELVDIVKNELKELHFQTDGKIVYQQITANHDCNRSDLTFVYSSYKTPKDICASFLSSLPLQKWQPQHVQQKTDFCEARPVSKMTELFANNLPKTKILMLGAYPKSAAHKNTFMPVWEGTELDVKEEAIKHGESFFYINIKYQGTYDKAKYPCNEMNFECACLNPTYVEDTLDELRKRADISHMP